MPSKTEIEGAIPAGANYIGKVLSIENALPAGTNYIGKVRKTDGTTDEKFPTNISETNGASALTILAAAGVDLKNRIFRITLTSSVAGAVVLSDGFGTYQIAVGTPLMLDYGPQGKLQTTANTAITATLATATFGVLVAYSTE